jgi:tRNA G18 (ribose-2'-O)-methylase SpoU
MNVGSLFRTAHAFGASFVFTVDARYKRREAENSDTSRTAQQVPLYEFDSVEALRLPTDCALVGVELLEEAAELPSFRHPRCAAYVLGPERGSLSAKLLACCDQVVKIPTKFCVNLAVAGAIVMYDRQVSLGRFARRPEVPGGGVMALPAHEFGGPVIRRRRLAGRGG